MDNLTAQSPDQPTGLTPQARNAFLVIAALLAGHITVHTFFIYLALQTRAWQLYIVVGLILLIELVTLAGIGLIRRGRPELGIELSLGVWLMSLVGISVMVAGLGLLFAFAAVILVSTIAGLTLPQKSAARAIVASVVVGAVVLLLDLYVSPAFRFQLAVPVTLLLAVVVTLALAYIVFIARQFTNYSLRTKLIIAFVAVGVLSVGAITFLTHRSTQSTLAEAANQSLLAAASQTGTNIDTFIEANLAAIRAEAQIPVLARYLALPISERGFTIEGVEVATVFRALSAKDPTYISSYALLDREGFNVVDTNALSVGLDESDRDYFKIPFQTGQPYVSSVEISQLDSKPYLYFSSPVRDVDDNPVGVLRVRYKAGILQQLVAQNNGLAGPESFATLLDENNIRLAHGAIPELVLKSVVPFSPDQLARLQVLGRLPDRPVEELSTDLPDFAAGLETVDADEPYFTAEVDAAGHGLEQVAVARIKTQPAWLVAFAQPEEVFLAPIQAQTQGTLLLAMIITVVTAGVAFGFGQFLVGPLIRLTGVAEQVAAGDLTVQAPVESQDETGQLAAAFNSMTAQLRGSITSLEVQVQERTAELALSMEVGQRAAAIRDIAELLPTITEFIREQFDLYYVHVYFVDDLGQNLVIQSGTGAVGKELMARHHTLPVGPGSIVGHVAAEGRSIVVSDTGDSDIHKPNPLLPDTRSEVAIPLIVEERVMGVLDMQASQVNTFTTNNLTVFEAMATQLAISIDSARQWVLAQEAQQRSEEALRQFTRETWAETLAQQKKGIGFAYDLASVTPLEPTGQPPKASKRPEREQNGGVSSVPLSVQNEPIGYLAIEKPADRPWSEDEQLLLEAVAQQLAQKAENLRLFEDTQQRAAREQIARQIADKIRASRDIETALKTAAEQLSRALGVSRAVVDLKVAPEASEEDRKEQ